MTLVTCRLWRVALLATSRIDAHFYAAVPTQLSLLNERWNHLKEMDVK